MELPSGTHPWFFGVQFHPEFTSTPRDGHPLFSAFIQAALKHKGIAWGRAKTKSKGISMKLCDFEIGLDKRFFLIAGTCVIESEQMALDTAGQLKEITSSLGIPFIYKSSFDKANRSSGTSFRGLGMEKGLEILAKVKKRLAFMF